MDQLATNERIRVTGVRRKKTDIDNVLPPVAELAADRQTILRYIDLDGTEQVLDYGALTCADPHPIPMPVDREGYGTVDTSHQFWATGYGDWLNIQQALKTHMVDKPLRLFDFGCATGRFLRHAMLFSDLELTGSDFAPANVQWVKRHLPTDIRINLNSSKPSLPYPDNHFDVVTAFSVFTHIDSGENEWLEELRRITRPGGILYLTVHNQAAWNKVAERPGSFERMSKANTIEGNIKVTQELFSQPMPESRIVFRMSDADIYNCNVWMTNEYIEKNWSRYFDILQIADNAHTGYQSPVILRPRA